jgi:integrase
VVEALAAYLSAFPRDPEELFLIDSERRPLTASRFSYHWRLAAESAGAPGLRYHDLRHTFASTLLSRGVSIKAVADWLGHASPTVTLATYAHLMPTDDEVARGVLDEVLSAPADFSRTSEVASSH